MTTPFETTDVLARMTITGDKLPRMAFVSTDTLDPNEITPIEDSTLGKPSGGLWLSPVDEHTGRTVWEDWSIYEEFQLDKLKKRSEITLDNTANILVFNDDNDFTDLPDEYWSAMNEINWSKVEADYDGVYLTDTGNDANKTRMYTRGGSAAFIDAWWSRLTDEEPESTPDKNNRHIGLWDIESVLIFDHAKDKVNIVSIADIVIKDKWDV